MAFRTWRFGRRGRGGLCKLFPPLVVSNRWNYITAKQANCTLLQLASMRKYLSFYNDIISFLLSTLKSVPKIWVDYKSNLQPSYTLPLPLFLYLFLFLPPISTFLPIWSIDLVLGLHRCRFSCIFVYRIFLGTLSSLICIACQNNLNMLFWKTNFSNCKKEWSLGTFNINNKNYSKYQIPNILVQLLTPIVPLRKRLKIGLS